MQTGYSIQDKRKFLMVQNQYYLRPPRMSDIDAAVDIHCDPRTNLYRPGGAPSRNEVAEYIPDWINQWEMNGIGYWSLIDKADEAIVGFGGITLKQISSYFGLNLYFRLSPTVWGKGLASFIGKSAFVEAFENWDYKEVYGLVRPQNLPSCRALERLGLTVLEEVQDVPDEAPSLIYRITREDYYS